MLNSKDTILEQLRTLGLSREEAKVYVELLKEPNTHLRLAHATGINRTKIYRLADMLEKRSLVAKRTDDRGTFLVAADPSTLEVQLVTQEEQLKQRREAFTVLLPALESLQKGEASQFVVRTYEGEEGFKQMLWHELKTKGENLIFGSGTIDDLVGDERWAEKHRAISVQTNYRIRELLNPGTKSPTFTLNKDFVERLYRHRIIGTDALRLDNQTAVYNDTVAVYHWRQQQKVGVEIISETYARMMRDVFEHFWAIAKDKPL